MRRPKRFLPAAALAAGMGFGLAAWPTAAHAQGSASISYAASAAAPVMQITEDEPTSQFHPEGEGEYGYTLVTANQGLASALAAVGYPGSTIGHAGTLVEVLGGPSESALNDPVQASAQTGSPPATASTGAAPGPLMTASVAPVGANDQHATATSTMAGGGLGSAGTIGNSTSTSTIDFNANTAILTVTAHSSAGNVNVGGVVRIGSVTSSASAVSTNGATPVLTGATTFHDMTVAGQAAYVDGSGVHLGSPNAPAGPAETAAVDTALQAAGMEIYFTSPHTIVVGGTAYYYASSVLFYWKPPGDPSGNSFTAVLGGSGVSLTDTATNGYSYSGATGNQTAAPTATPTGPVGSSSSGGAAPAAVGTVGADGGGAVPTSAPAPSSSGGTSLSLPANPAAAVTPGPAAAATSGTSPAGFSLPAGIGGWWLALAILAGLFGAGFTTRLPALLDNRAAAVCPRQKLTPVAHAAERPDL